jgi:hypothetical protein
MQVVLTSIGLAALALSALPYFKRASYVQAYEQGLLLGCALTALGTSLALDFWG